MRYKYSKFTPDDLDGIDLEELVSRLSDLLLFSGFSDPFGTPYGPGDDQSLEALHDAILDALLRGEMLPEEMLDDLVNQGIDREALDDLISRIIDRLEQEGYVTTGPDLEAERRLRQSGPGHGSGRGQSERPARFEMTDKTLDFLGYRTLRDLLASLGRSSFGRHDTRDFSTGIETAAAPKPYEFGDTMNLDASQTILNAVRRRGVQPDQSASSGDPGVVDVEASDLMVAQGEYQSSCATVVMLDCSHSMILYGEDRFTPAKRVALALANLIRIQYPGDVLKVVLFHDTAEEIPLKELARVRVGPYYTNTREGLRLARRILERQRKDMRQIIMITDGKPSALTRPDGRVYKNAFGLDPFIVSETLAEVAACRKTGVLVNTFMLARDYDLVSFVRRVAEICRGKAYFTTPHTLGQYVLMDYVAGKTRTVH